MKKQFLKRLGAALCTAAAITLPVAVEAQINLAVMPVTGPLSKQTMTRLLLTDSARIGNRIVAVGDRGYIVYSDSNGESWERAATPPGTPLLNAVFFTDPTNGWAVGHDAVILKSTDEGKTWTKIFSAPDDQKPLMDILFIDANNGLAVGAYGAAYETTDAGKTWTARRLYEPPKAPKAPAASVKKGGKAAAEIDDGKGDKGGDKGGGGEEDRHLNAVVKLGANRLLVVGEAGMLLKSDDNGKTWSKLASPYKGSFFGAIQAQDNSVVIYGLRGKIFRSTDAALKDWKVVENKSVASVMGSTRLPDGTLVLSGLQGTVLTSRDNGATFTPLPTGLTKGYASPLLGAPNAIVLVGEAGARDVLLPAK
ncbi:MAG: YCF48-related protein [Betaproteobacteria bacterium]